MIKKIFPSFYFEVNEPFHTVFAIQSRFVPKFLENIVFLIHKLSLLRKRRIFILCISKSVHFKASLLHILKGFDTAEVGLHNICAFRMSVKSPVLYSCFGLKIHNLLLHVL